MNKTTRRNFIGGAAGLAAASAFTGFGDSAIRPVHSPEELAAFQKELDAISPADYGKFQLAGLDLSDDDRLAAYAALPGLKRYDAAFDRVFAEIAATPVTTDTPAIWYVYNMGVVVKTRQALFTIDVNHRQAVRLVPQLDFALISHNHRDHYSEVFLRAMDRAGKTVVSNFDCNYGAHYAHKAGGYTRAEKTFTFKDVSVRVNLSDHNNYLIDFTTVFEITIGDFTLYHTGDSANIAKLTPTRTPDLWIVHPYCCLKVEDGIAKFHPKQTAVAHLFELGHAINRWRFGVPDGEKILARAQSAGGAAFMPLWGDRLV